MIIVYNFSDGDGNQKVITEDLLKIKNDRTFQNLFDSDKYGQLPATGIEPVKN